jgi:MFS family permease
MSEQRIEAEAPASSDVKPGYRYVVLAMLILAYTFNFLDRQILGILKEPIKNELHLTDTELGLMGGLAFAALYTTLGVPIAWLADRFSRTWIMTAALTVWSGFTMACGLAGGFWSLFLCRMGVGVGEAGGVPPAYSLLADYFPKHQRARALAAYSFGIPLGTALGVLFGGLIAAYVDWRMAFVVVGAAGVLLAPLFKLVVRDPPRGGLDAVAGAPPAKVPGFGAVLATVLPKPSFWLLAFGAACSSVCGYGVAFWLPSFFIRSLHLNLVETSIYYSAIAFFGGVAGIWLGGFLGDKFGGKSKGAYALAPAICFLIALPCFFLAMNTKAMVGAFLLFLIPTGLNLAWLGPVVTAVQHLAPAAMRSTTSALFLLINNLLGIAVGYWFFGFVSDRLAPTYGAESMRYAIYWGLAFYLGAAALLTLASTRLKKDWVE